MVNRRLEKTEYRIVILMCHLTLLFGCASFQRAPMPRLPDYVPAGVELESFPFYAQDAYQCGPATLAMALNWRGLAVTPDDLKDQVYTPSRKGSLQLAMVAATRRHGKTAYQINDPEPLFMELAAGHPMIILQNLGLSWLPVWHYAVVIGYDVPHQEVILRSGTSKRKVMSYHVFEKTWARSNYWGLMVLEPYQIPASAEEETYLRAIIGLEKSRHFQAAATGYQTALTRWPASLNARLGLGNCHYALGDLKGAESAFREATEFHPRSAVAFNNLAHVLMEQGHLPEALATAKQAVALGGPLKSESEKTLQDIRSRMR